ncbi:MAG: hypothetical protein K2X11_17765, partial [Acetobacteraceae bacterium]|nr:hypothetical protein [Acetobacteraceae bacterium]
MSDATPDSVSPVEAGAPPPADGPPAPLTRDMVTWAYRLLLGREPEASSAVEQWLTSSPARLRDAILASDEMDTLITSGLPLRTPLRGDPAEAARAVLALIEGEVQGEEAVQALLAEKPGLASLRRHLVTHPTLRPRLFPSIGLSGRPRRQPVLIGGQEFAILADAMEPELRPLPARVARLAAVARAALPESGAVVVDGSAGIGLTALALLAG